MRMKLEKDQLKSKRLERDEKLKQKIANLEKEKLEILKANKISKAQARQDYHR